MNKIEKILLGLCREKCTDKTAHKFIEEHESGYMLPIRFLRLFRYLNKDYPYPLNKEYKTIINKLKECGLI